MTIPRRCLPRDGICPTGSHPLLSGYRYFLSRHCESRLTRQCCSGRLGSLKSPLFTPHPKILLSCSVVSVRSPISEYNLTVTAIVSWGKDTGRLLRVPVYYRSKSRQRMWTKNKTSLHEGFYNCPNEASVKDSSFSFSRVLISDSTKIIIKSVWIIPSSIIKDWDSSYQTQPKRVKDVRNHVTRSFV